MSNGQSDLEFKAAIAEQLYRWTRGADRLDLELMQIVFLPDAIIDYGGEHRLPSREFLPWVMKFHGEELVWTLHAIQSLLARRDGDTATSEAVVLAILRYQGEDGLTELTVVGRYLDDWKYVDGRWLISNRLTLRDAYKTEQVHQKPEFGDWFYHVALGQRDKSDPSYRYV